MLEDTVAVAPTSLSFSIVRASFSSAIVFVDFHPAEVVLREGTCVSSPPASEISRSASHERIDCVVATVAANRLARARGGRRVGGSAAWRQIEATSPALIEKLLDVQFGEVLKFGDPIGDQSGRVQHAGQQRRRRREHDLRRCDADRMPHPDDHRSGAIREVQSSTRRLRTLEMTRGGVCRLTGDVVTEIVA
jgi:hypothetical protein